MIVDTGTKWLLRFDPLMEPMEPLCMGRALLGVVGGWGSWGGKLQHNSFGTGGEGGHYVLSTLY